MAERVVVTGLGCLSPLGDAAETWQALIEGRSGISQVTAFDPSAYQTRIAGEVRNFDPSRYLPQREVLATSRCVQLAVAAARMALADSGLDLAHADPQRIGVFMGTSMGPLALAIEHYAIGAAKGITRVHPMAPAQDHTGVVASEIAILLGLRGPSMTIATACTSGPDAIGIALGQLRAGMIDVALAGASEAPLFPWLFAAFDRLGLMSRWQGDPARASRPFALDRDGIVVSEGAAVALLETETAARARGAPILAEVAGYGATCDAYHHFHQRPGGEDAARAICIALQDARCTADQVDYISAHGTGTPSNDPIETAAVKQVFGERAGVIPMSAIKSMTGHLMGACGALEFLAGVRTLVEGVLPPTINLAVPDPACDLDYVPNEARRARVRVMVSNSFGFGSRNAALVLKARA